MAAPIQVDVPQIRPLRSQNDLAAVADLVELCFAESMDADGREYLRQMRRIARNGYAYAPGLNPFDRGKLPIKGYLWEEDGQVIGNLTIISFLQGESRTYLIANVAVHPDFRRKGIARKLTLAGLEFARSHGAPSTWLHVRDDNYGAIDLYRQLGFIERARRATWQYEPDSSQRRESTPASVQIGAPLLRDWPLLSQWLDLNYPAEVTWNFKFEKDNYRPGFLLEFWRFLKGERMAHLAAHKNGQVIGSLIWEPTNLYADTLWIASPPELDEAAIPALLTNSKTWLPSTRPLAVNYPAGRAGEGFESCDFSLQNTLIWMEHPFNDLHGG